MFIGKASLNPANSPRFLISRKSGAAIALRKSFIPKLFFHPHGNCFCQFKSNFVSFLQNAPQAKPRFCAAELNSRILALRRKGTAARGSDRCQLRAAGKPDAEPKANVGFSSPHGNCFWQYKSNFVNFLQNAPQAKPRFCAAVPDLRIPALRRKSTAARGSDRCQLRAAGKPDAEPKANVGFSSPHGNCFCQFKSNFVNSYSKIALILLTPAEEDCSLTILKCPKTPVLAT